MSDGAIGDSVRLPRHAMHVARGVGTGVDQGIFNTHDSIERLIKRDN